MEQSISLLRHYMTMCIEAVILLVMLEVLVLALQVGTIESSQPAVMTILCRSGGASCR